MKIRAVILAGGEGSRLSILTAKRTKPAVPFAGKYRIIDFVLSNCVNSGIFDVMVVAQYRPHSLIEHIGSGAPWDLNRDWTGGVRIYTPYRSRTHSGWFVGTADAVQQNFRFVKHGHPDLVLILSGDHIYKMDYDPLITFHLDHQADLTMGVIHVPLEEAPRFGIVDIDQDYRVTDFVEKPAQPPSNLANMGIYLFNLEVLDRVLWEDAHREDSSHDFGKDILPRMVRDGFRVFAFPYAGYWMDVGTVQSYWQAHMDLLQYPPSLDLNDRSWIIHTRTEERPPARIRQGAQAHDSLISDGCIIEPGALVERSVLSPGVRIRAGAVVRESVVLTDTEIGPEAHLEHAILDKHVRVGAKARIGALREPLELTLVGKNAHLPSGLVLEPGVVIGTDVQPEDFPSRHLPGGTTLHTERRGYEA
ncbi:MAG TPA: glucose-1-phosphate adenylyltransferase [Anaerolineae bacterium]|nr:glucose-1-phosphate adenylyltransferase [Anaerolineae bacterium]HID84620.1 glucose-1-phosphate adenylyltransferase [Anaerolineales bacterium]HIQ09704.1 glucose-1-phosphate adenylyltransferase [Anaerolineaceae bacterium]